MQPPKIEDRLLRERDIVGDRKSGTPGIIPVSRSTWWSWVAAGRAPQPIRLGGVTCWRLSTVLEFVENGAAGGDS